MHRRTEQLTNKISFCKFRKRSNSGISLNWSIIDEVTTRNKTFLAHYVDPPPQI